LALFFLKLLRDLALLFPQAPPLDQIPAKTGFIMDDYLLSANARGGGPSVPKIF
jgi:hypothetical protein